jgi:hypothetical protein
MLPPYIVVPASRLMVGVSNLEILGEVHRQNGIEIIV